MPKNIFTFGENEERILGIVKAKYGLNNKNEAMELILKVYSDSFLEPELRPGFLRKINKIKNQRGNKFF